MCIRDSIYSDPNADRALAELADMGVGWVSIVVTQYQDTVHSTAIAPTEGTPTDADVRHAIRAAHAEGLNVMLKPHVDLWNDPNHWRGEIGPNFTTAQWNTWFASYTAMITHYAQLAAEEGVEQFSVGTELNSTTGREAQWRAVIAAVGAKFDGTLTYACLLYTSILHPWEEGETIGDQRSGDPTRCLAPIVPPLRQIATSLWPRYETIGHMALLATAAGGYARVIFTNWSNNSRCV